MSCQAKFGRGLANLHRLLRGDFIFKINTEIFRNGCGWPLPRGVIKFFNLGLVVASIVYFCARAWGDQSVSLAWDPSRDPSVAGYRLHVGPTSGHYTASYDVGTNTVYRLTGLKEGQTNYLAVTSYDSIGAEGLPSVEISYLVPGLMLAALPSKAGDPMRLSFPVAPGHWYGVQASVDLKNWSTIWQTSTATSNAWVVFQDPQAGSFPSRYYRLAMH